MMFVLFLSSNTVFLLRVSAHSRSALHSEGAHSLETKLHHVGALRGKLVATALEALFIEDNDLAGKWRQLSVFIWVEKPENRCFSLTFQWPENLVQWCVILSGRWKQQSGWNDRNYKETIPAEPLWLIWEINQTREISYVPTGICNAWNESLHSNAPTTKLCKRNHSDSGSQTKFKWTEPDSVGNF